MSNKNCLSKSRGDQVKIVGNVNQALEAVANPRDPNNRKSKRVIFANEGPIIISEPSSNSSLNEGRESVAVSSGQEKENDDFNYADPLLNELLDRNWNEENIGQKSTKQELFEDIEIITNILEKAGQHELHKGEINANGGVNKVKDLE
ncbi:hypothetical protein Salat_0202400 [Sesamum alatum]|uniref:Uncharacterized protein n=1 Tax=Sesamum alatum TaxID=300844 RepID=A0AAE2CYF1_9LAMI|nr:hypothetical protein Salat_0202400 [Sesamum alatum]